MGDLDEEWLSFANSTINEIQINKNIKNVDIKPEIEMPKCSEIYISTKTRTCELNSTIDLYNIFWKLKVIKYYEPTEGIIKKSMKFNCNNPEEVKILEENLEKYKETFDQLFIGDVGCERILKEIFEKI